MSIWCFCHDLFSEKEQRKRWRELKAVAKLEKEKKQKLESDISSDKSMDEISDYTRMEFTCSFFDDMYQLPKFY